MENLVLGFGLGVAVGAAPAVANRIERYLRDEKCRYCWMPGDTTMSAEFSDGGSSITVNLRTCRRHDAVASRKIREIPDSGDYAETKAYIARTSFLKV